MDLENNYGKEIDLSKKADELLLMHTSRKTLLNNLHALVVEFEAHLDTIIKKYKIMSITLLAATGAAVGFSFSIELKGAQLNPLIMAGIVGIFGIIGLFGIWYLDMQVFHRFWGAFFVEEIIMEETHPFLVDVGDVAASLDNIKARLVGDGNWYIFLNLILFIASATIFSFAWQSTFIKIGIFILAGLIAFLIVGHMLKSNNKILKVVNKLIKSKKH